MAAPEPIATGTLAKTPFPHLLVYLDQKKLSGTLAIWPDPAGDGQAQGQDRVLFLKGRPIAGRLLQPTAALREGLIPLFARTAAPYAFYEGNLLGDDRVSGRIDPFALIVDVVRQGFRPEVIEAVLGRFGTTKLRMQPGIELPRYDFTSKERGLIELVQAAPGDVASLVRASGLPVELARGLLYALAITRAIAPHGEGAARANAEPNDSDAPAKAVSPAAPPARAASAAHTESAPTRAESAPVDMASGPGGDPGARIERLQHIPPPADTLSPELRDRWQRVMTKGRLIENQNYFEMLDVDKNVKAADARTKFYQLAKEWHPDRLPPELAPLREYAQIIFSYLSEANATVGDDTQRPKYLQQVQEGGGTPATDKLMQAILDSAMEYERVLVMVRRHQYDEALELLRKILAVVKDEPDYHAMHASLLMQKFPGQEAPLKMMLDAAEAALALHAEHEKALTLKAQILRRMGKPKDSLDLWKKIAAMNPNNIEAVREVRVATMRNQQSGKVKAPNEESPVAGLLGKLFNNNSNNSGNKKK